jgi:hypothetical protein
VRAEIEFFLFYKGAGILQDFETVPRSNRRARRVDDFPLSLFAEAVDDGPAAGLASKP